MFGVMGFLELMENPKVREERRARRSKPVSYRSNTSGMHGTTDLDFRTIGLI